MLGPSRKPGSSLVASTMTKLDAEDDTLLPTSDCASSSGLGQLSYKIIMDLV